MKAGVFTQEISDVIRRYFDDAQDMVNRQTQSYLVHHDLANHNIRYDPNTKHIAAIYDRENAVAFDPISELGAAPTRV